MENIRNWWSDLHYTSAQKRSLLILAGLILATSSFFILRTSTPSEAIAPPIIVDVAAVDITIDIQGAVAKPGVYQLPIGSRVVDAIKAAGGVTKVGDPSDLNQARKINDGEQIYVYAKTGSAPSIKQPVKVKPKSAAFVLVNRAGAKEFEALDGIGPVLASRIVSYRKANGPFASIDDLLKVPGIGAGTLSKFKSKLRV